MKCKNDLNGEENASGVEEPIKKRKQHDQDAEKVTDQ